MHNRRSIKIAGQSGQGISSLGEIVTKTLKELGYKTFEYREYPSLIQGGFASSQIDISDTPLSSSSQWSELLFCMGRASIHAYLETVAHDGVIIHALPKVHFSEAEQALIDERKITVHYLPAFDLAHENWGNPLFANQIFLGLLWQILNLDLEILKKEVQNRFKKYPETIDKNMAALDLGHSYALDGLQKRPLELIADPAWKDSIIMTGNDALAFGAIAAGVRAYFGYPMTPSTSIMSTLIKHYHETGMIIKQAEDEITAAQMAIGAMHMGTRALTGTSGGGFDLMTETVSLSGITEIPFVCVIAQRPGPATGLPTWTGAGDLNLALYAGHGEFPRCVLAASDPQSAFELIQHAMNITEEYQIPVLLLTDKHIGENMFNFAQVGAVIPVKRGLAQNLDTLQDSDRYKITASGISPRWIPGSSAATFLANSDEHLGDGTLTEDAIPAREMYEKRLRKEQTLLQNLPEPILFGAKDAANVIVSWGSNKAAILDAFAQLPPHENVAYLHFDYIHPLRTDELLRFQKQGAKFYLVEANYMGQLGAYITQKTGIVFADKFLKYDGRPFFVEEMMEFLTKIMR
jgi:2-oxoglutarate ferredoxin oxidoreductase subunit alpha